MKLTVVYSSNLTRQFGIKEQEITFEAPSVSIDCLLDELCRLNGMQFANKLYRLDGKKLAYILYVNGRISQTDVTLIDGDRIGFFNLVTGG